MALVSRKSRMGTICTLIQGHPDTDFLFSHTKRAGGEEILSAGVDTRELREILGDDVPLNEYEVIRWIEDYLKEQYEGPSEE